MSDDFTKDLIKSLNKDQGTRVAYNLAVDESPTHVRGWISTGSKLLDYICSNRPDGGLPEGRIVEIFGPPSIGKSHIATQIARSTQHMGGIVVYIDTENATSVENLGMLGVDVSKRFVYVDTHCTEEVLDIAEKTILKAKALDKDVPITIIWDSVAASSPKAELLGDYDKESIGLQARAISKGMRLDLNNFNIKVTSINPGLVETEFSMVRFKNNIDKARNVYKGMQPLKANDVAEIIDFIIKRPDNICISDISILPKSQASSTVVKRSD